MTIKIATTSAAGTPSEVTATTITITVTATAIRTVYDTAIRVSTATTIRTLTEVATATIAVTVIATRATATDIVCRTCFRTGHGRAIAHRRTFIGT